MPAKFRKAIVEYVGLVGLKHGQRKDLKSVQDEQSLTYDEISKQIGVSVMELRRILSIERNLIPELKQALDKFRKAVVEYVGLVGKKLGDNQWVGQNVPPKLSQEQIAKELGLKLRCINKKKDKIYLLFLKFFIC